jgi:predicted nucleic acid-binding protein
VIRAVIDTNVLLAALRSSTGASSYSASNGTESATSNSPRSADVCQRPGSGILIPKSAVDDVINRVAQISRRQAIHYLWRGILSDPKDDMVLELAVAASASHIITFNHKHLKQASEFGIAVVSPSEFLNLL